MEPKQKQFTPPQGWSPFTDEQAAEVWKILRASNNLLERICSGNMAVQLNSHKKRKKLPAQPVDGKRKGYTMVSDEVEAKYGQNIARLLGAHTRAHAMATKNGTMKLKGYELTNEQAAVWSGWSVSKVKRVKPDLLETGMVTSWQSGTGSPCLFQLNFEALPECYQTLNPRQAKTKASEASRFKMNPEAGSK